MSKHKYAEMIKAKVDNMELVVFINNYGEWEFGNLSQLVDLDALPAFLCLPQHNENGQCLHWLNGGEAQLMQGSIPSNLVARNGVIKWSKDSVFMDDSSIIRIKPKKEKRWIGVHKNGYTTSPAYETKDECMMCHFDGHRSNMVGWQFIEIEVEV